MKGRRVPGLDGRVEAYLSIVRDEGAHPRPANLRYYFDYLLRDLDLTGKRVLEIGGGRGTLSFYAAVRGAERVVCLEPESAGSTAAVTDSFKRLSKRLGLANVELRNSTFQTYDSDGETFDLLVLNNSINHLEEPSCIALRHDATAQSVYHRIFEKMHRLSRPGGMLIISDCAPYNAFALLGLRNPLMPSIEWHKHQTPWCWAKVIARAGFGRPEIRWSSINTLRGPGRMLLGNALAAFFLTSHFCLRMTRV
jgi:SAM-dependent methyltransferase